MNSIVIYATHFGNTRKIAEAIVEGLRPRGSVRVFSVDEAPATLPQGTDLVLIGGPTEEHKMTEPVARFFDRIGPDGLQGVPAAAFDTRVRWPRWLSGSAAGGITERLRQAGAHVIAPPESFFIKGAASPDGSSCAELERGELERAAAWAAALAASLSGASEAASEASTSPAG